MSLPPPPGQMVDIGGFRLHAVLRGSGSPTVILEPGLGGCALQYGQVQQGVSAFTRVLAYDRAGQAWSDPSPDPRTPANLDRELRALLAKLDLQPPYVLVGHSFGGLTARFYAGFHPADVAGLVLVDSSDVQQYDSFPSMDKVVAQMAFGTRLLNFASRLGLAKPLTRLSMGKQVQSLSKADLDAFVTVASQPRHNQTTLDEFSQHHYYFGPDSQVPKSLGNLPLMVVTAGNSVSGKQKFGGMTIDQLNEKHQQWQRELAAISTRGEHLVIPGATHFSIIFNPEHAARVVEAVRCVVDQVRAG